MKMTVAKFIGKLSWMLLKAISNQRGQIGDQGDPGGEVPEFLQGTPFKTPEDLAKGYGELLTKIGEQGTKMGSLETQNKTLADTLEKIMTSTKQPEKSPEKNPVDYEGQMAGIQKEIQDLDPLASGYQSKLAELIGKSNQLIAAQQHEKTLSAASSAFKKELDARDAKSAESQFLEQFPDYNSPEMQQEIKDHLAKDKTGMHDPFSAYFHIKANKLTAAVQERDAKISELQQLVELNEGKKGVGKVITKTQTPGVTNQKPQKATGAALLDGMRQALAPFYQ